MCGISGYVRLNGSPVDHDTIERMVVALKHRGPDAQTVFLDGPVGFGHARLSIIDLAGGDQPLFNEDRSISVICNGEIYNYRELTARLKQRGHQFRTGSDCEVLAHLWEESGTAMLDELRGMFAFVLYDRNQQIVFGARDRFGQKPLYYHQSHDGFSFASEIKGLLVLPEVSRDLDPLALDQFLFHQYVPQPRTLFQGIKKLAAGCCFELKLPLAPTNSQTAATRNGSSPLRIWQYWKPTFDPDESLSTAEHLDRVEAAVVDAVKSHLVSDVPVGVFLSGGIDSSLITAIATKFTTERLQSFSISFPGSVLDEGQYAREVADALGTEHRDFPFAASEMRELLIQAATLFDQPLADTAVLPLMALSRHAAKHVKVVLTGDGGDEVFAGYRKYRRMAKIPGRFAWLSQMSSLLFPMHQLAACYPDRLGLRRMRARLAMVLAPATRSEYHRQGWEGWERFSLYQPNLSHEIAGRFAPLQSANEIEGTLSPLNTALRLDQGTVLADRLLLKGDCATMAYGLEARAPLLDHHLADVAGRLPLSLKVTPKITKVALRDVASRYLPASIIARPKKGFSIPLADWLRNDLREWVRSCLLDDSVTLGRCFQRPAIEQLLNEHQAGKNHAERIHTLLMFELWCRVYSPT